MMDRINRRLKVVMLVLLLMAALASAVSADGITLGSGAVATGNQVYFGTYKEKTVLWRVLKTGDGKALLLSEYLLDSTQFNPNYTVANANVWQDSTAQSWCGDFYSDRFTLAEKSAVIQTSKTDAAYRGRYINFRTSSLNGEYIFFLSAEEAETYFSRDDDSRKAYFEGETNASFWWLRSPAAVYSYFAGVVDGGGCVMCIDVDGLFGARPALT